MKINNTCILCNGNKFNTLLEFKNHPMYGQKLLSKNELEKDIGISFDILKCDLCNLVQIGNKEVININFYDDEYLNTTGNANFEYQKNLSEKLVNKYKLNNNKKVIELGCLDGFFSKQMLLNGCDIYAIEPSGKAYEYAKSIGLNVERKYIEDITEKFDFFILRQVLEHIDNPNSFLQNIIKIMNHDFNGVIEIPRLENIYEKNRIFEFYPEHVAYYDLQTLSSLLGKYFTIDSIKSTFDGQFLIAEVSKKKTLNIFINMNYIVNILKNYIFGEILMWGAGAKGINILSLLGKDISSKIILVDGDVNKHGKYTPVTHNLCEDKNIINIQQIKIIIISADMYKTEIIKELYEKYNYRNDIVIISDIPEKKNILEYYK